MAVPSSELDPPRKRVCLPPWTQQYEEQHCLAGKGDGGLNSDDWTESLALWILFDVAKSYCV